ncbi:tryptophan halogenase family protein [Undibacterium baiyunense]|uniref:Tryptophan 7-halogenase n=1 Tax=Undibacterium baiyunense TaxID=2828731 RepID=A0A941DCN7_9BURK|nr:tryptophan halogenase family protein [Undibacterium baiyunense]MBR7745795.1 tryptophan 7-halogenase [Undibacterium baiyunense]
MRENRIKDIVIVGGGTAGWMSAAALIQLLPNGYNYRLIESDQISTIGVGEATIPSIRNFNMHLGIDENDFLRNTQGTFKLGIEFVNWGINHSKYFHGFGSVGRDQPTANFFHYWLKLNQLGMVGGLEPYSINTVASMLGKFSVGRPDLPNSPLSDLSYAYHFDAGLYARYLRTYAEQRGVKRTEGRIVQTLLRQDDGFVEALVMENGEKISADFFIDCSGMVGLLIEKALQTGYDDWSHWLPCDTAIAVPCELGGSTQAHTRSTAHTAGWQWRIPLQHRIGNGHVFSSHFMDTAQAQEILMNNLDGRALAEPRQIKFTTGKRKKVWNKNVVAIGLSGGFMEPLESTSIHMVKTGLMRLISFFPDKDFDQVDIDNYNRLTDKEYSQIRDFLILHYKVNQRDDSEFWRYCRNMPVPDSLQLKLDLFTSNGRILRENEELFPEDSWLQVMHGQGMRPRRYNPVVDQRTKEEIAGFLYNTQAVIRKCVDAMPTHLDYIRANCLAKAML